MCVNFVSNVVRTKIYSKKGKMLSRMSEMSANKWRNVEYFVQLDSGYSGRHYAVVAESFVNYFGKVLQFVVVPVLYAVYTQSFRTEKFSTN